MNPSIVVLKFGSSVLQTAADLPLAIEKIYREWRASRRVIAVVSAVAGLTDRRFAETRAATTDLYEQAAWVAGGEEESGTKLAAALNANGGITQYSSSRDSSHRTFKDAACLLGRGGSDLTALFLAKSLNARCRAC